MRNDEDRQKVVYFCVDSGASQHIANDMVYLCNMQPSSVSIRLADNSTKRSAALGTVSLEATNKEGTWPLELRNVLLLESAFSCILSVPALTLAGHSTRLNSVNPAIVLDNGLEFPLQQDKSGLFWFRALLNQPDDASKAVAPANHSMSNTGATAATPCQFADCSETVVPVFDSDGAALAVCTDFSQDADEFIGYLEQQHTAAAMSSISTTPALLLHRRFGHLNEQSMRSMGLLSAGQKFPFCEPCALAKSKRKPVAKKASARDSAPGQLTHTDLCGPMEGTSLHSHALYALVFVDDATRYTTLYLMQHKNQALHFWKVCLTHAIPWSCNRLGLPSSIGQRHCVSLLQFQPVLQGAGHSSAIQRSTYAESKRYCRKDLEHTAR